MDEKTERVIRIDLDEFKIHIRLKNKTNPMLFMIHLHFLSPEYQGKMLNGLWSLLDKKIEI